MAQKYEYTVEFDYTEGQFMGKGKIVPKRDNFYHEEFKFEGYQDTQLKAIINAELNRRKGERIYYIVNIRILDKISI